MTIALPKEILPGEKRVALVPDTVSKLIKLGFSVIVEKDAGFNASFTDDQYKNSGAEIINSTEELYQKADLIIKVQRPVLHPSFNKNEAELFRPNSLLISFLYTLHYPDAAETLASRNINSISMDMIPRTTLAQRMDAMSSQSNIAGYKSVIMAANEIGKIFPMMMTAAGTIAPARVVIMGAGVAGLQALGTAKRLGAVVNVSDIRSAVKEEVQSLGGRFIEVEGAENLQDERGYAKEASPEFLQKQKELIFKYVTEADIVIATALVPGRKSPILVTEEMVKNMKRGSVIVDMAVEFGGNCELSENGKTVEKFGIKIIGEPNIPALIPTQTSELYSKNIYALIEYLQKEGNIKLNLEDEIVKSSLITYEGKIFNERTIEALKNKKEN